MSTQFCQEIKDFLSLIFTSTFSILQHLELSFIQKGTPKVIHSFPQPLHGSSYCYGENLPIKDMSLNLKRCIAQIKVT